MNPTSKQLCLNRLVIQFVSTVRADRPYKATVRYCIAGNFCGNKISNFSVYTIFE